jgi:hypothetical protein
MGRTKTGKDRCKWLKKNGKDYTKNKWIDKISRFNRKMVTIGFK